MRRVTATQPEEFTEEEREAARQAMLNTVMKHTNAGIVFDFGWCVFWMPCDDSASSRMFH
jgi:hypothetical protein